MKEKQANISSRKVTVISDSDDGFESSQKLPWTSYNNPAFPSPLSLIHQPEALQDQSVRGSCSAQYASFVYRLAKDEAE